MDWHDRTAGSARIAVLFAAALLVGGCDLLTNADFLRSLRREPGPQDASPITEQGIGKLAKGDLIQAAQMFDEALRRNPADVHALLGKAVILQRWGQADQARQHYQSVLNLRPDPSMRMVVFSNLDAQPVAELASINLAMLSGGEPGMASEASAMAPASPQMAPAPAPARAATTMAPPPPAMSAGATRTPQGARAVPYLSDGDLNVMSRFETLAMLRDRGLVTPDEYAERRRANLGALLPMTSPNPAATGLDRPAPPADQILGRLNAIARALELRAINVRQHAAERGVIIDGLLPAQPRATQNPPLPPKDLLQAADHVRRLETMKERSLISNDEYTREREAVEKLLAPPAPPPPPRPAAAAPTAPRAAPAGGLPAGGPRPAVHIASYRSEAAANNGWTQLRRAHQALLGNLQPDVVRVNLGAGKGVYFRLMAGPLPSQTEADRICRELKARRQFCETTFMTTGTGAPAPGRNG